MSRVEFFNQKFEILPNVLLHDLANHILASFGYVTLTFDPPMNLTWICKIKFWNSCFQECMGPDSFNIYRRRITTIVKAVNGNMGENENIYIFSPSWGIPDYVNQPDLVSISRKLYDITSDIPNVVFTRFIYWFQTLLHACDNGIIVNAKYKPLLFWVFPITSTMSLFPPCSITDATCIKWYHHI